mgnify:CR=1 FL=1
MRGMPAPDETARLAVMIRKRAQGVIELKPFMLEVALAYPATLFELAQAAGCTELDARRVLLMLQRHKLVDDDGPIQAVIDLARQVQGGF